ncbi:SDR family NAD(P)-dependent oxidoreductase [Pontibacter silvestris]|uniref:SDR family NAD(P)-dependent oxidoreductase n=1 Tax=Pontibacter silvestris TaxID=2305183 RepID=A0ABW4WYM7_9BACT|nr:SDR family oxidoreductase [Pontibacter silvestris]MCC9135386.1 SDR family oxidoreductase [Pontibacter silvestris]
MKKHRKGEGKTVLITGASNGFGMEFAKLFAKDGYNLILVARSTNRMKALAYSLQDAYKLEKVCVVTSDLSRIESPQKIYNEVKKTGLTVDVLVNNAGSGHFGYFYKTPLQRELDIIQLNATSLMQLTKLFLKDMKQRNEGKILNLGSVASFSPTPLQAIYGATKAYILSFSEALANELKDTNITVTTLCPGASNTDFFHKAHGATTRVANGPLSEPEEVARDGYKAMMKGELKVISGAMNKAQVDLTRVSSDAAMATTMQKMDKEME